MAQIITRAFEVVVVLPFVGDRVLMQLRDLKPNIPFPGNWGYFGGAIEKGERPLDTAYREINEEIGLKPSKIYPIDTIRMAELGNIINHSFFCPLNQSVEQLKLKEGMDLGLFTLEEVLSKMLYSKKLSRKFPVIPSRHVAAQFRKLFKCLKRTNVVC